MAGLAQLLDSWRSSFAQARLYPSEVAEPNFLLRQHLEKAWIPGTEQSEALGGNSTAVWDVISQEESHQILLRGTSTSQSILALKDLSWLARARGAQVAVLQTWPWRNGNGSLWPSFAFMQDIVNNATSVYMEDALQFDRSIFLAPVGLGYEFIHDILDTANYAHGRSGMQNMNSPRPIPADNAPETSPKSLKGRYPFDIQAIVPGSSRAGNSAGQTRRNGALLLRQEETVLPSMCAFP
ncbi:g1230 [Coccomyxa elongata]